MTDDQKKFTGRWAVSELDGEISVIRKDFKLGFESCGWSGSAKIVLSDSEEWGNKKYRLLVRTHMQLAARALTVELNRFESGKE